MSQIRFFSAEQEALIPQIQAKWQNIYLSTEKIDRDRAREALEEIYTLMGKAKPEIEFCNSPQAALERLETYISEVEIPQTTTNQSPEEMMQGVNIIKFFAKALIGTVRQNNKRKKAGTKVIHDLVTKLSQKPHKSLVKLIDKTIPQDLTTQQIVEQSLLATSPIFNLSRKKQAYLGRPHLTKQFQYDEDWKESAFSIEQQLAWLPGKKFFFRLWLKRFLQGAIVSNITGIEYPKLKEIVFSQLSFPQRKFLSENPPVITSD